MADKTEETVSDFDLTLLVQAREAEFGVLKYAFALNGAGMITVLNLLGPAVDSDAEFSATLIKGGATFLVGVLVLWLAHTARVLTATAFWKFDIPQFRKQMWILTASIGISFLMFMVGSFLVLSGYSEKITTVSSPTIEHSN